MSTRPLRTHGKPRRASWFNRARGQRYPEQSERQARGRHQDNLNERTGFVTIGLKPGRERGLLPKGVR